MWVPVISSQRYLVFITAKIIRISIKADLCLFVSNIDWDIGRLFSPVVCKSHQSVSIKH